MHFLLYQRLCSQVREAKVKNPFLIDLNTDMHSALGIFENDLLNEPYLDDVSGTKTIDVEKMVLNYISSQILCVHRCFPEMMR